MDQITPIAATTLSDRTKNWLHRCGIHTLSDLLAVMEEGSIRKCRGIGEKRLTEICNYLAAPEIILITAQDQDDSNGENDPLQNGEPEDLEKVEVIDDASQFDSSLEVTSIEDVEEENGIQIQAQPSSPKGLIKIAIKIIAACGPLSIEDLSKGLDRKFADALVDISDETLLEDLSSFGFDVSDILVSYSHPEEASFSASEKIIIDALREADGFLNSPDLRDALLAEGFSVPTFYNLRRKAPYLGILEIPGSKADYVYLRGTDLEAHKLKLAQEKAVPSSDKGRNIQLESFELPIDHIVEQPDFTRDEIKDIDQFEAWLRWQFSQIELIGELSITKKEFRLLGELIAGQLKGLSRSHLKHAALHNYPACFAALLVTHGVFNYSGGTYWPGVLELLGGKGQWRSMLGRTFLEIIHRFGLETFDEMGGLKFVSRILGHGGIPDYCLSDYFGKVLVRATTHPDYLDLSPEEIIEAVLDDENAFIFVDKPVRRFLEFGGKVSEDFFSRSLELVEVYVDTRELPNAQNYGLPKRIGVNFAEWVEENIDDDPADGKRGTAPRDRIRIRKPYIVVDPWGDGVVLHLPSQEVPATSADKIFGWKVSQGVEKEVLSSVDLRARKIGLDYRIDKRSITLDQITDCVYVQFRVGEVVRRNWRIPILEKETPLLICQNADGVLMNWKFAIPAESLWLFHPKNSLLEFSGEANFQEEFPKLYGSWGDFIGGEWDLSDVNELLLTTADGNTFKHPIRPSDIQRQSRLVEGEIFPFNHDPDGIPVYCGRPPKLILPVSGRQKPEEELTRWRIEISNKWSASPELHLVGAASIFGEACSIKPNHIEIDLSHSTLLGEEAWGTYLIRIRGPLGKDANIKFRIWPSIDLEGIQSLYIPSSIKDQNILFNLAGCPDTQLVCQAGVQGISISEFGSRPGCCQIEVDPHLDDASIMLVKNQEQGDQIQLPIFIPLPVLKWSFWKTGHESMDVPWSLAPLIQGFDDVLDSEQIAWLRVSLPHLDDADKEFCVRLVDPSDQVLQASDSYRVRNGWHVYRIPLSEFRDSIRNLATATCKIELEMIRQGEGYKKETIHLLTLREPRLAQDIHLERIDDENQVIIKWKEVKQATDREVRITSVWRVWESTLALALPEDARSEYDLGDLGKGLSNGRYQVEIIARDPWLTSSELTYRDLTPRSGLRVDLESPQQRHNKLTTLIGRAPTNFDAHFERACLLYDLDNPKKASHDMDWCIHHLQHTHLQRINALHRYLINRGELKLLSNFQNNMFVPIQLQSILMEVEQDSSLRADLEVYFESSPQLQDLSVDTALILLAMENSQSQLKGIQALLHADDRRGIEKLMDLVVDRKLSDRDALDILAINGTLAISELSARSQEAVPLRLLEGLIPFLGDNVPFIRVGTWIRTNAGWGKILEIMDASSGEPLEHYIHGQHKPVLEVILREGLTNEKIRVDLLTERLDLVDIEKAWMCRKCRTFCTHDKDALYALHNRYAHGGQSASLGPVPSNNIPLNTVQYSHRRPDHKKIWV